MDPSISDHALLCLKGPDNAISTSPKSQFKFLNCVTTMADFFYCVSRCWNEPLDGRPMFVLRRKLLRLQPVIRKLSRPVTCINITLDKAREDLRQAHSRLLQDRMNPLNIIAVKEYTEEVIKWSNMEE
ncbi:hypothetical protein L195_g036010 [Trifolium pratense]|uniref:Uncharacterized protein n=1 Tax=Trifolium pratense TaxID=57577 RepID=A0A2K3LNA9_TRIPR|nr:hypothetical protein L195_g036010 [Trifolium pratense]